LSAHVFDLQQDSFPGVNQDELQSSESFLDDLLDNFDDFDPSEGARSIETPPANPPNPHQAEQGS
jgi:hypothetical protein